MAGTSIEAPLRLLFHLHLLSTVERDLAWFVEHDHLTPAQAEEALDLNRRLCAEVAPHSLSLLDAFGVPSEVLHAPIANDWVDYNVGDRRGELTTKEEFQEILRGGSGKSKA